jgi:hypothetical protein
MACHRWLKKTRWLILLEDTAMEIEIFRMGDSEILSRETTTILSRETTTHNERVIHDLSNTLTPPTLPVEGYTPKATP